MIRRRRIIAFAALGVAELGVFGLFGHRGVHASRNLLVPGSGLYDHHLPLGLAFTAATVVVTVAWLRWGTDWMVGAVVLAACVVSAVYAPSDGPARSPHTLHAAHEFPLVVLVAGALSWMRLAASRLGLHRRASTARIPTVDGCQAVAIACIAGLDPLDLDFDRVRRRARRVGVAARLRFGGDPLRVDHAHARAALALLGRLDDAAAARFVADARRSGAGVPASEPGLVRLIDGTLAAVALTRLGDGDVGGRWAHTLATRFRLRGTHRPAFMWTPLAVPLAHATTWEHAAATAIAHAAGWCGPDDWAALRRSSLGAAARGGVRPHDARLVAAARVWTVLVDDEQARRIVSRPTLGHDPVAAALDALARRLAATPGALRVPPAGLRPPVGTPG